MNPLSDKQLEKMLRNDPPARDLDRARILTHRRPEPKLGRRSRKLAE